MHCYVDVKNFYEEVHIIGIADNKEVVKVIGVAGGEWKVIQIKEFPTDLKNATILISLFNDVMIEAEKQRISKEPKDISFLLEDGDEQLFVERLCDAVHYLYVVDNMLNDEVMTTLFKDRKGRIFEVTYAVLIEYDHTRHPDIQSWKEI